MILVDIPIPHIYLSSVLALGSKKTAAPKKINREEIESHVHAQRACTTSAEGA